MRPGEKKPEGPISGSKPANFPGISLDLLYAVAMRNARKLNIALALLLAVVGPGALESRRMPNELQRLDSWKEIAVYLRPRATNRTAMASGIGAARLQAGYRKARWRLLLEIRNRFMVAAALAGCGGRSREERSADLADRSVSPHHSRRKHSYSRTVPKRKMDRVCIPPAESGCRVDPVRALRQE
jgi:hypothetical protein